MVTKRVTIRIPPKVYRGLEIIGKRKPHLSLNAIIVEALSSAVEGKKPARKAG